MPKIMPKIILRCPACKKRGDIKTRVRTRDRRCPYCGYVGPLAKFEVEPEAQNTEKNKS